MSCQIGLRWLAPLFFSTCLAPSLLCAQAIGAFVSVEPTGQTQGFVLPETHVFQCLAQSGDTLPSGALLKSLPDFTAYVAANGSSAMGWLSLNHELYPPNAGVTVFDATLDPHRQLWSLANGQEIDFSNVPGATARPCSGGISPWGTVVYGEELLGYTDLDSNGFYDYGWLVEIDPAPRQFVQKIHRAGRAVHENCAFLPDSRTLYWGGDDWANGFIFKYIADQAGDLSEGRLFVLRRDSATATTGVWVQVPNQTPDNCNNINAFAQSVGAFNFFGVEDVEIGPDGRVYFATKYSGRVWRFRDEGDSLRDIEVFVENTSYAIETASGAKWISWGVGADNLAFDREHNLWVLQDGGQNNIWVVGPGHSAAHPQVRLFATTPFGSEPTGISFSPDGRYLFMSIMHPSSLNFEAQTDAAGRAVVFNRGTTLVLARREFLGTLAALPPEIRPDSLAPDFSLAPNPLLDRHLAVFLKNFPPGKNLRFSLADSRGQVLFEKILSPENATAPLDLPSALPPGAYFAKIEAERWAGYRRLVVGKK